MTLKLKPVHGAKGTTLYAVGTVNGTRINRSTGFGPKERRLAAAMAKKIENELSDARRSLASSQKTLADFFPLYQARPGGVGVTTLKHVTAFVAKNPKKTLDQILPADVISFATKPNKCGSTIRREINAIQGFINFARELYSLPKITIRKPSESQPKSTRFTDSQRDKMLDTCARIEPWFVPHLTFLFFTGARRSELCRLVWQDVLLDDAGEPSTIIIRSRKGARRTVITRRIPVHPSLAPLLKAMRILRRPTPEDRVFYSRSGVVLDTPSGINKAFDRVALAAGLSHLTPHDARRTFATALLEREVSDHLITDLLGHVDVRMLKTYAVVGDDIRRRAVEKIHSPVGVPA